jgi:hypothetical protein
VAARDLDRGIACLCRGHLRAAGRNPATGGGRIPGPRGKRFQRRSDFGLGWYCVQLVLGLNERHIVFAFKKGKNRLDLQVVGDDFLAYLQGEEGLIEGERSTPCVVPPLERSYSNNPLRKPS